MKILVTGGSGYLGTHVCRFFDADNFSRRTGHDILDDEDVKLVAEYDAVIHLAAHLDKDPQAAELCFRTNADGAANVVKNLKPNAAFIYASTRDVYGTHANVHAQVSEICATDFSGHTALEWSKLLGERYVKFRESTHVRACIFRCPPFTRGRQRYKKVFPHMWIVARLDIIFLWTAPYATPAGDDFFSPKLHRLSEDLWSGESWRRKRKLISLRELIIPP